jgi:nitrogen-specific signal transduction histidine kinase
MRIGIRTKQVAGVTAVVALATSVLLAWYVAALAQILLEGGRSNAQLILQAIYQRVFVVVARGGDVAEGLRTDDGLRTILESSAYSPLLVYAVIVDPQNTVMADAVPTGVGRVLDPVDDLDNLIDQAGPVAQIRAIYAPGGRQFEVRQSLVVGENQLGTIRVGVSTLLVRQHLQEDLFTPVVTAAGVVGVSILVAMLLAQLVLRPIHVIRSGLARLGRGELDVNVDLPADTELRELGDSFRQVTARLVADRTELAGQRALESFVDRLEDAVALFGMDGALLFSNAAMAPALGGSTPASTGTQIADLWPAEHPYRASVEHAIAGTPADPPEPVQVPGAGERLILTNVVRGADGAPMGVLLVSRNLAYLSQVETTLKYSRKLAALSRLTSGIAHEIKNPLNATMIHLELLRLQLTDRPEAEQHVAVIAAQVRRLDEVLQGFMKFTRPEDLHLEPVELSEVFDNLRPVLGVEAGKHQVELRIDVPASLPMVDGDANLLEQAFLNLSLNAFQAMPDGGKLTIRAREAPNRLVTIEVEDTGTGIEPEHLSRIFDLYFTTRPQGSGIGLSLVFRTVQLHDGEIEVQSTPGRGTTFRIQLRQAAHMFQGLGG